MQACGKQLRAAFRKPADDAFSGEFHSPLNVYSGV